MIIDLVQGYACLFDVWSQPVDDGYGRFRELICPNAFNLLASGHVRANVIHAEHTGFAGTGDGSLRLWVDRHGLGFEADIPGDLHGAAIRDMVARSPMQVSIGISDASARWGHVVDGLAARVVTSLTINHISLCVEGAYPGSAWLASMPVDTMPPYIAAEAVRWRVGRAIANRAIRAKAERRLEKALFPAALLARVGEQQGLRNHFSGSITTSRPTSATVSAKTGQIQRDRSAFRSAAGTWAGGVGDGAPGSRRGRS